MKFIPYGKHHIDTDDIEAVIDVLKSGWLTQGPMVEILENAIASYVGAKYAVAVSSGTAALHIAALAAGIEPHETLLTSPITFVASANAGRYAGAKIAFADIDPETINISATAIESKLQSMDGIKIIVPVHFAGLPCDMERIGVLARQASAVVIEDAAHALGAIYPSGKRVGSCENSLMTIFSFHPVKAIAAGEGGLITTNDEAVYRKLLRLRGHGINKLDDALLQDEWAVENSLKNPWYYEMQELGFNYRITDIQCALAVSQFRKIDNFLERRKTLAKQYDNAFASQDVIKPAQVSGRDASGHHLYVLRADFGKAGTSRADFMRQLFSRGIGTQVHYIPVPAHPYYRGLGFIPEDYPEALKYYREALSIPFYYDLADDEQQNVISAMMELQN